MIFINPKSPQEDIPELDETAWDQRTVDACALIDEPNPYGIAWTSDRIRQIVTETFSPDTRFYLDHPEGPIFSDPFDLDEQRDIEVIELNDHSGYVFDYHLPLNGKWSDLTAQFEFYKRSDGYAVVLHDLYVL